MCGLVGIYNFKDEQAVSRDTLLDMLKQVKHRGPDEFGIYIDDSAGLGCARLSIVDLDNGRQPVHNEDKTKWAVFTGEIYNYKELMAELTARGHRFYTNSDTETILHLFEESGADFMKRLNGQFAIAIWDTARKTLLLARDRSGIRPLHYAVEDGRISFASEIKSLFADARLSHRLNPKGLDQIVTFWTTVGGATAFEDIFELPPGNYLIVQDGKIAVRRYWDYKFYSNGQGDSMDKGRYIAMLREGLCASVKLRLPSEVAFGIYISGGVDSSVISTLVSEVCPDAADIKTFSIRFLDRAHDETEYQKALLRRHGFKNFVVTCASGDIGAVFPEVIRHTEKPLFRTAAAPLYMLSRLARQEGIKVVLSGEGADEVLWGYDTYRENKIRLFWSRFPDSARRPLLLKRIFPYLAHFGPEHFGVIKKFYQKNLMDTENPFYSHLPRWQNNEPLKAYYSQETKLSLAGYSPYEDLMRVLSCDYNRWEPLQRNQYLETLTLLPGYLLSSQGDRMLMANSVEGRYPFLDHNFVEFCGRIPSRYKVFGIRDKHILREAFKSALPEEIYRRSKFAYTAPDAKSFFGEGSPEYIRALLSRENIERSGYFSYAAVENLVRKLSSPEADRVGYRDNMAAVLVVSTLLLHSIFIEDFRLCEGELNLAADFDYRKASSQRLKEVRNGR